MKAVKKINVEAEQLTTSNWRTLRDFCAGAFESYDDVKKRIGVWTVNGESRSVVHCNVGDFIVKEVDTDGNGKPFDLFRVVKSADFAKQYDIIGK